MREMLLVGAVPAVSLVLALGLGLTSQAPAPGDEGQVLLVLVPPWRAADAVIAAAGGVLLPQPPAPLAVLAAGPGPDFAGRLRAAGALFVLAAQAGDGPCGA